MGLDMYLKTIPKVEGYDFKGLITLDNELLEDVSILPEVVQPYAKRMTHMKEWYELSQQVSYWRKANQIHNWFVENVQNGVDDCEPYEVTEEDLVDLVDTIESVLKETMRTGVSSAAERLPITEGFFFGNSDYDEYYFEQLLSTQETINKVLNTVNFDEEYVYYRSSW